MHPELQFRSDRHWICNPCSATIRKTDPHLLLPGAAKDKEKRLTAMQNSDDLYVEHCCAVEKYEDWQNGEGAPPGAPRKRKRGGGGRGGDGADPGSDSDHDEDNGEVSDQEPEGFCRASSSASSTIVTPTCMIYLGSRCRLANPRELLHMQGIHYGQREDELSEFEPRLLADLAGNAWEATCASAMYVLQETLLAKLRCSQASTSSAAQSWGRGDTLCLDFSRSESLDLEWDIE